MVIAALLALAATAGNKLVEAMVTDGWEGVRGKVAKLFGRGDKKKTDAAADRLEQSRAALAGLSGPELEQAAAEQQAAWRTRLTDLLEDDPGAEAELRQLVTELQAVTGGSSGTVVQHAVANDHAQQAVQGHGVQNVHFGGPGESSTSGR